MTQSYVSNGIITQGNYSKFEKSILDVSSTSLKKMLDRLEVSLEELVYIENDYNYNQRDFLIYRFYNLIYNDEKLLQGLADDISAYLSLDNDIFIKNIKKVCIALIVFIKTKDIDKARIEVEDIWKTLSRRNHLYISDIHLINSMLFLFPLATSREIKIFLFRCIDRYKGFQKVEKIKINCTINFSILLIKEKQYSEAIQEIDSIHELCHRYSDYLSMAICNIRKGVCITHVNHDLTSGLNYINKGLNLLHAMEENKILEIFNDEIERYIFK